MSLPDLAVHGVATQSSIYAGALASRGIDRKAQTDWHDNSCALTQAGDNAWWKLDMGSAVDVQLVRIISRNGMLIRVI